MTNEQVAVLLQGYWVRLSQIHELADIEPGNHTFEQSLLDVSKLVYKLKLEIEGSIVALLTETDEH